MGRMGLTEEVRLVRIQEGESGKIDQRLTEERIEELAGWYGLSKQEKAEAKLPEVRELAQLLGISPALVRKAREDKRVMAQVRDRLDIELLYAVVEARPVLRKLIHDESVKPDNRIKAIRTQEELAGFLKQGPKSIVSVSNIVPTVWESLSDEEFADMADHYLAERGRSDKG